MIHYVSVIATNFDNDEIVLLEKLKGHPSIIGKITVPGGKVEGDEQPIIAAARELEEEAGLVIDWTELVHAHTHVGPDYMIDFYWYDGDVSEACAQEGELEKVYIGSARAVIDNACGTYMQDVSDIVRALSTII